jgi:hypothetical protein
MSKNPKSSETPTLQKQDATMSAINEIVQTAIQLVALSVSVKCDCAVCKLAKEFAPHVAKILSLRKARKGGQ